MKFGFRASSILLVLGIFLARGSMITAQIPPPPPWVFERAIEGYGYGPSMRGIFILDSGEIFSYRNDGNWDAWSNKVRSLSSKGNMPVDEFTLPALGSTSENVINPKPAAPVIELTLKELNEKIGTDVVSLGKMKEKDWEAFRHSILKAIRSEMPPRRTEAMDTLDTTYRVYLPATNSSRLLVIPLAIQQGVEEDSIRPGQATRAIRDWLDDLARRYQRDIR